ncbi:phosphatase PAP2 family protein [Patescibacteria group bacterium]|nr:phosphatase PAP2 family protein [Patescibacteria group bacterium]
MNDTIFFFFYNLAHQSQIFDNLIIFLAVYFIYVVVVLAVLFLFQRFSWKEIILLCMSAGFAFVSAKILKILFHTPRPFDIFSQVQSLFLETGYAFPSGHTAVATAVAFAIFFTNKKTGYLFMFLALIIGVTRIIAGVHFPVDILGGFILGGIFAYLVKYVYNIVILLCGKK